MVRLGVNVPAIVSGSEGECVIDSGFGGVSNMRKSLWFIPALLMFAAIGAPAAKADTIFTDLGPGYNANVGWDVTGSTSGATGAFDTAGAFTSSGSYAVTQIDLGIGNFSGTNGATVELTTDNSGAPGTVLQTWNISGQPVFGDTSTTLATISGITGIDISAGTYFLVVLPDDSTTYDVWNYNSTGATGLSGVTGYLDPGNIEPAFDVLGSSISAPEPSSLILLGAGLLGLVFIRRKRFAAGGLAQS
jgi:hypothetical protein